MASTARFDVVAIGNAIVDVLARADDALIEAEGLTKGSMRLIDADEATRLYAAMGPAIEVSGGSAANTLAGMAALGERCAFIGQVADDQLGHVFTHDLRALGVAYETPALKEGAPTARCLILVTPDGQRTMNTFLGASHLLEQAMIDEAWIADSEILYLEGYLWDPELSRAAMRRTPSSSTATAPISAR
jgi:sugar/nucleoside kinase (ribokinase family)